MHLVNVAYLAVLVISVVHCNDNRGDLCQGDKEISFKALPKDVQVDFFSILMSATNAAGGSCMGIEPNYNHIELLLYTNSSRNYTRLNATNPIGIANDAPLYILSHGWLSGFNGYKIKAFREKYVKLFGKNVIFVNWGKLAWYPYPTAACNIPFIGQYVANFLCTLSEKQNYGLNNVHIIGHSLGGQLAGFAGKGVQKLCNKKLGRITALDPAGPMFQLANEKKRLSPKDANFVEVVHSNAGLFGYIGKAGTVDYHLNCGSVQPGCFIPQHFNKIAETSIYMLACPHMRSLEIWPYVLESRLFKARSYKWRVSLVPGTCLTSVFGTDYVTMGHTYTKPLHDHYNINTPPYPPFHSGCFPLPWRKCS